jgi:hypothetical protein
MIIEWNRGAFAQMARFMSGVVLGVWIGGTAPVGPVGPRVFIKKIKSASIENVRFLADRNLSIEVKINGFATEI